MSSPEPSWSWHLTPNHRIDVSLGETGLSYRGTDWDCQSGGAYMAGFQSFIDFERDGPLKQMPPEIEAEVRAAVKAIDRGHRVVVRISGERPDEIHMSFHGQSEIKRGTSVVFDGELPSGSYEASGILIYRGSDEKGRRRMLTFSEVMDVDGPTEVEIDRFEPRFPD